MTIAIIRCRVTSHLTNALNIRHLLSVLEISNPHIIETTQFIFRILYLSMFISGLLITNSNTLRAAEDTIRGSTTLTRPHPELEPSGISAGSYLISPVIKYTGYFDDNVFATSGHSKSSYVSELSPEITARSNWGQHALNFSALADIGINHTFKSEDYEDWDLNADGKIQINSMIDLFVGAGIGHDHISRGAPNDVRGLEPTTFDKISFFTRYNHRHGKVNTNLNFNIQQKIFQNAPAIVNGTPTVIDNSDRDRTQYTIGLRSGYEYIGDERAFIVIRYNQTDYDKLQNATQFDRSSKGIEASVGASFDYHGLLLGQLSLGYRSQDYADPLPDINTPLLRASIQWNITDLSTATLNLDRSIRETIDPLFSGYISTRAILRLDHELQRNLLLNLSLLSDKLDYLGIPPANRDDQTYDIIVGSTYKVNRNLHISVQYQHYQRKGDANTSISNFTNFDYAKNLISFQVSVQY